MVLGDAVKKCHVLGGPYNGGGGGGGGFFVFVSLWHYFIMVAIGKTSIAVSVTSHG